MNPFKKTFQHLSHGEIRSLAVLCGSAALLVAVAVFVSGAGAPGGGILSQTGISPASQTASVFGGCGWLGLGSCAGPGPVTVELTLSRDVIAPGESAILTYTVIPSSAGIYALAPLQAKDYSSRPYTATFTVSPPTTTTYTFWSYSSNGWLNKGSITLVVATPPAPSLSIAAIPSTVDSGSQSTVSWSATGGAGYDACYLGGGQWGSGGVAVGTAGSSGTGPLNAATQFWYQCHDTYYGWQGPVYTTVNVNAPPPPPVTADASYTCPGGTCEVGEAATVNFYADTASSPPTQCQINNYDDTVALKNVPGCPSSSGSSYTTPAYSAAGVYAYKFYYYRGGWTFVKTVNVTVNPAPTCPNGANNPPTCNTCTPPLVWDGSSCVAPTCANGLDWATYGPSCTCPANQHQSGNSCVANICANGLDWATYGPSCACPAGQHQSGSSCVVDICVNGANNPPACNQCTAPKVWDAGSSSCINAPPALILNVAQTRVQQGHPASLSWSVSNLPGDGSITCSITSNPPGIFSASTNGMQTTWQGTNAQTGNINSTTIFTLSCTGFPSISKTVTVVPVVIEK